MCVCCGRHQHHQSSDGGVLHFSRCQFRRNDLRMPARSSLVELASNCGQCHWLCSVLRAKQSSNITLLILRGASQWKTIVFIFVFVCCCLRDDSINRIYSQTGAKIRIGNATIHNNIEWLQMSYFAHDSSEIWCATPPVYCLSGVLIFKWRVERRLAYIIECLHTLHLWLVMFVVMLRTVCGAKERPLRHTFIVCSFAGDVIRFTGEEANVRSAIAIVAESFTTARVKCDDSWVPQLNWFITCIIT